MNDNLLWILDWFYSQCDGDWEHGNGIKIGTLDNPGWFLKVSISETAVQNKTFQIIDINRSENDWMYCSVEENLFKGYGGPFNLPEIIQTFRDWIENHQ